MADRPSYSPYSSLHSLARRGGWLKVRGLEEALYFRLRGVLLSEHINENSIALRCINLNHAKVSERRGFRIKIKTANAEKIEFFARNRQEWRDWVVALKFAVSERKVSDEYVIGKRVGEGAYGSVRKAIRKSTDETVAVKIIDRKKYNVIDKKYLSSEISIIMSINHPGVIETYDIFDDGDRLYLVMKYVENGTLEDVINKNGPMSEAQAKHVTRSLLSVLGCLHSFGIVHRDIKGDNVLCQNDQTTELPEIKLSDFGLGAMTKFSEDSCPNVLESVIGSWYYIAPEQARCERYGATVDLWAAGVLCYRMLSAEYPFSGKSGSEILAKIRAGRFEFGHAFDNVSEEAKSLVKMLLEPDANRRPSALEALQHEWVREERSSNTNFMPDIRINSLSSLEEDRIRLHRLVSKDMDFDLHGATVVKGLSHDETSLEDEERTPQTLLGRTWRAVSTKFQSSLDSDPQNHDRNNSLRMSTKFSSITRISSALGGRDFGMREADMDMYSNPASPFG